MLAAPLIPPFGRGVVGKDCRKTGEGFGRESFAAGLNSYSAFYKRLLRLRAGNTENVDKVVDKRFAAGGKRGVDGFFIKLRVLDGKPAVANGKLDDRAVHVGSGVNIVRGTRFIISASARRAITAVIAP